VEKFIVKFKNRQKKLKNRNKMKTIFKAIVRELKEGAKNAGAVLRS
jgi:hypothetical protein